MYHYLYWMPRTTIEKRKSSWMLVNVAVTIKLTWPVVVPILTGKVPVSQDLMSVQNTRVVVYRQPAGRSGRQGDPESQIYLSPKMFEETFRFRSLGRVLELSHVWRSHNLVCWRVRSKQTKRVSWNNYDTQTSPSNMTMLCVNNVRLSTRNARMSLQIVTWPWNYAMIHVRLTNCRWPCSF